MNRTAPESAHEFLNSASGEPFSAARGMLTMKVESRRQQKSWGRNKFEDIPGASLNLWLL